MNALIPAVCTNPKCGEVFFSTFGFAIAEGISVRLSECQQGACPKCRSLGLIPSGLYKNVGDATHFTARSEFDRVFLERALAAARKVVAGTATIEQAKIESPELKSLLSRLGDKLTLPVLIGLITLALTIRRDFLLQKPPEPAAAQPPRTELIVPEGLHELRRPAPDEPRDDTPPRTAPPRTGIPRTPPEGNRGT